MSASVQRRTDQDPEACAQADERLVRAFELLGQRWTAVVIGTLSTGPAGFRAIARAVGGISDSMLSSRLSSLTDAGLVKRTVDAGPPVTVTYELTLAGLALMPALNDISAWADRYLSQPDPEGAVR